MQTSFAIRLARTGEFLLGALFLSAAVLKLANVPLFASQILSYDVISSPASVAIVAEVLVPIEVLLGVAMMAGLRMRGYVFYAAIAMLALFSALVAYAWPANCGCFGPIKLGPVETLAKNGIMFIVAAFGALVLRNQGSSEPQFGPIGKWLITLLMAGLSAYFAHDELYNSEKYFKSNTPKTEVPAPIPPTPKPDAAVTTPSVQTTPPAPPNPTPVTTPVATANASDDEAYPDKATGTEDYPVDAPVAFKGYTVTGQDGKALDLGAGTYLVALLNATCHHCMHTVPAINQLAVRPDVPTVVALVQEPDPGSLNDFVQQTGASFPIFSMGNDFIKFAAFIKTAPPRFTLERDGRPIKSWEGYPPTAEELQAAIPK